MLTLETEPDMPLMQMVSQQLDLDPNERSKYSLRDVTRREQLLELQTIFGFKTFSNESYHASLDHIEILTLQTDKPILLANVLIQFLREKSILLPSINGTERIRDLAEKKLYVPDGKIKYDAFAPVIGGSINLRQIQSHWDEILRLAASIRHGTVSASLIIRKIGSYPPQNGLAVALHELGKIERTLFTLE